MKQFDSPVRGNILHMRPLRDEHNGSKACNDADPRPTLRNGVPHISLTTPLWDDVAGLHREPFETLLRYQNSQPVTHVSTVM